MGFCPRIAGLRLSMESSLVNIRVVGGKPLGSNCVVVEGTVVTDDGGRGESEGAWY